MIKKTEKKMVEQLVTKYIAMDGREFHDEKVCADYENAMVLEKLKNLTLVHRDDFIPCNGAENPESRIYEWYHIEDQRELDILNEVYNTLITVRVFPEYVCIDRLEEDDFDGWGTTLTECKKYVTSFFKDGFGISVTFDY